MEAPINYLEPGVTPKRAMYNFLSQQGVYLPSFRSNCLTVDSLLNHRNGEFHFYMVKELEKAFEFDDILIAPVNMVYTIVQKYHIQEMGKPLAYLHPPPENYLKIIVRHIDPDNELQLLKMTWTHEYLSDIFSFDGKLVNWTYPQGQGEQRRIDNVLNNALRFRNSRVANFNKTIHFANEYTKAKSAIQPELVTSAFDKILLNSKNVKDVYGEMMNLIEMRQIPRPEPIKVTKVTSYADPEQSAAEDAPDEQERISDEQAEENIRKKLSRRKGAPNVQKKFDEESK